MSEKQIKLLVAAYTIVAIVTFGRAWVNAPEPINQYVSKADVRAYTALGSALFWPLYWSVVAWEKT